MGGWVVVGGFVVRTIYSNNTDCKILNIIITLLLYYERTAKEGIERYLLFVDYEYASSYHIAHCCDVVS